MNLVVSRELFDSVGWTLLHFIWQGAALGILVWIALQLCSDRQARLRYFVLCIGMLVLIALPLLTLITLTVGKMDASQQNIDGLYTSNKTAIVNPDDSETTPPASANDNDVANTKRFSEANVPIAREKSAAQQSWMSSVHTLSPWLTLCWAIGVFVLSLRLMIGWSRIRTLRATGQPIESSLFQDSLHNLKDRLGIRFDVRLYLTRQIDTPTVIGWFKPVILLPASAVTGLSAGQVAAVLAHELAHIRRHDYLVNLIQSVVEVLLFYHPVVWWISNEMRKEREHCCDDLALEISTSKRDYVEALLSLEQHRSNLDAIAVAATGGSLLQRVSRILGKQECRRNSSFVCGFASLMIACVVLTFTLPIQASPAIEQQAEVDSTVEEDIDDSTPFQILVVNTNGEAIPNASIRLNVRRGNPISIDNHQLLTGDDGFAGQDLSNDTIGVRAWCSAEGFAPLFANWEPEYFNSGKTLPNVFTFIMLPAAKVGGRIVDEQGKPIEGVKIQVTHRSGGLPLPGDRQRYNSWLAYGDAAAITDTDGRWTLENVPPGDDVDVSLTINHPEFASDEYTGDIQRQQSISMKELAQQTSKITMKKGARVHGTVTIEESGEPITDALVIWGDNPYMQRGSQEVQVNKKGQFILPAMRGGKKRITILAPGYKPETRVVDLRADMPATDFQMKPGKKLQIQFTDPDGNPIPGVYVSIQEWRNSKAMYNNRHPNVLDSKIPRSSDADGMYVWDWAPEDKVTFSFSARNFAFQREVALAAADKPHEIQLVPKLYVSGTVRDENGDNLDSFTVVPMIVMRGGPHERRDDAIVCNDGFFEMTSNRGDKGFQVKIEADGYQTHVTQVYQPGDQVKPLDVILKFVEPLTYEVIGVDGEPAEKATVLVANSDQRVIVDFSNGRSERPMSGKQLVADEQGQFRLQPATKPRTLMVGTSDGYTEVADLPDKPHKRIQLKKRYDINGKVAANLKNAQVTGLPIRFIHGKSYHIQQTHYGRTGSDGRFSMKQLPPLPYCLAFSLTRDNDGRDRRSRIAVEPDSDTVDVDFTTPVSGRIEIAGKNAQQVLMTKSLVTLQSKRPTVHLPPELKETIRKNRLDPNDFEKVDQFFSANDKSHERAAYMPCFDSYSIRPDEQGHFDFEIMRPGKYELTVQLNPDYERYPFLPLGELKQTVEVTSSGLDMGQLKVATFTAPKAGTAVENFMFKNRQTGLPSWLHSFRKKHVLLDFWKPWDEESNNDKSKLEQLARELDPELIAILSLHSYNRTDGERAARSLKSTKWHEGQIELERLRAVRKKLGALTPQYYILLDSEGKFVVGGDLATIQQTISKLELQK